MSVYASSFIYSALILVHVSLNLFSFPLFVWLCLLLFSQRRIELIFLCLRRSYNFPLIFSLCLCLFAFSYFPFSCLCFLLAFYFVFSPLFMFFFRASSPILSSFFSFHLDFMPLLLTFPPFLCCTLHLSCSFPYSYVLSPAPSLTFHCSTPYFLVFSPKSLPLHSLSLVYPHTSLSFSPNVLPVSEPFPFSLFSLSAMSGHYDEGCHLCHS